MKPLPYQKNWTKLWWSDGYQRKKQAGFDALDVYLPAPPRTILDIGCGMAWESRKFAEKYQTQLWLLDGDVTHNANKNLHKSNHGKWHNNPDTLLFYHSLDVIKEELNNSGVTNYHLIDAKNPNICPDQKFDLITSWLSCGFHYPVSSYRDLILRHSHENTVVSMDLRITKQSINYMPVAEPGVEIVELIHRGKKHVHCHLKFV